MKLKSTMGFAAAGLCAGAITGLFGAGGGMVLVPLLIILTDIPEEAVFPSSVAIILPLCLVSLFLGSPKIPFVTALPYLLGSIFGGLAAGIWGKKIPTIWLHRALGVMILFGGFRYLC